MEKRLNQADTERLAANRTRLQAALENPDMLKEIESFVARNLVIRPDPSVRVIKGLAEMRLMNIEAPFPSEDADIEGIEFSFDLDVKLIVIRTRLVSQAADEPSMPYLRIGETNPMARSTWPVSTSVSYNMTEREVEEHLLVKLRIQATADFIGGRYQNISLKTLNEVPRGVFGDLVNSFILHDWGSNKWSTLTIPSISQ